MVAAILLGVAASLLGVAASLLGVARPVGLVNLLTEADGLGLETGTTAELSDCWLSKLPTLDSGGLGRLVEDRSSSGVTGGWEY